MSTTVGCECGWLTDIELTSETNPRRCPECGGTIMLASGGTLSDDPLYVDGEHNPVLYCDPVGDRLLTTGDETMTEAYQCGRMARARGAWRVLANPASDADEREWLRGYDYEDAILSRDGIGTVGNKDMLPVWEETKREN